MFAHKNTTAHCKQFSRLSEPVDVKLDILYTCIISRLSYYVGIIAASASRGLGCSLALR